MFFYDALFIIDNFFFFAYRDFENELTIYLETSKTNQRDVYELDLNLSDLII